MGPLVPAGTAPGLRPVSMLVRLVLIGGIHKR